MKKDDFLEKISDCKYRIPKSYKPGMRVDGIIYADDVLIEDIKNDNALEQVANVAFLPGIVRCSLAMPDIHFGYGFCIGGVAATDPKEGGVISPGGVGFDINCGMRLLRTNISREDIESRISRLADVLYQAVPAGVGSKGAIEISKKESRRVFLYGSKWAVNKGWGCSEDVDYCEEEGALEAADPDSVSPRAYARGSRQVGTLGSGNHFVEVQCIDDIFDERLAEKFGLYKGQITVMIHTGSRGFGYQVCADYTKEMIKCLGKYGINVPDRQLSCAPAESKESERYIGAMRCAANYAWANRQVLTHIVRESFGKVFSTSPQSLDMGLVYDVAHNVAKFETYNVDGKDKKLCVHRKGATRSFGPGNPELPSKYKDSGQPVIIPGNMGYVSYVMAGTKRAEEETFGSTCHGAGRVMSRKKSVRSTNYKGLMDDLKKQKIEVRSRGKRTVLEEAPAAYKNIDNVVNVVDKAGLSKKVCRMRSLGVVKG